MLNPQWCAARTAASSAGAALLETVCVLPAAVCAVAAARYVSRGVEPRNPGRRSSA